MHSSVSISLSNLLVSFLWESFPSQLLGLVFSMCSSFDNEFSISVVSKTLHKKQKAIEKQYDNLVEAANRLALTVESDHNIIADSHELNVVCVDTSLCLSKKDLVVSLYF